MHALPRAPEILISPHLIPTYPRYAAINHIAEYENKGENSQKFVSCHAVLRQSGHISKQEKLQGE